MSTTTDQTGNRSPLNVDAAVRQRYTTAAEQPVAQLCCAVDYDPQYLDVIPQEILERDYGCGDPSRFLHAGETVLDLGSGAGKICYIAAQVVGPQGRVIGVDCNDTMLALARKYRQQVGDSLGYHNVEFRKGRIQDLQLDLDLLDEHLRKHPVETSGDWLQVDEQARTFKRTKPLIGDDTIDVVVSNCVLNLVRREDREQLFAETFRVLKRGGRVAISDIVCDEDVPSPLQQDADLWSGCISGAFREDRFLEAFERAGFHGIEIVARQSEPWAVVQGIEFRSVTVQAFKGKQGPCLERNQAVIYNGPWRAVVDDDGHTLTRGRRMAVCDKTFRIYTSPPYAEQITPVPPRQEVPLSEATPFQCNSGAIRSPQETKGPAARETVLPDEECCGPSSCC